MPKKTTAVSDEEIIAALLESGTVKEAAAKTGLTPRALYERMGDRDFSAAYSSAKADIVRQAVLSLNGRMAEAISAIAAIMNDPKVNAAVRLQAAQTILTNAGKFAERLEADEKRAGDYTKSAIELAFGM